MEEDKTGTPQTPNDDPLWAQKSKPPRRPARKRQPLADSPPGEPRWLNEGEAPRRAAPKANPAAASESSEAAPAAPRVPAKPRPTKRTSPSPVRETNRAPRAIVGNSEISGAGSGAFARVREEDQRGSALLPAVGTIAVLLLGWSFILPSTPAAEFRGGWQEIASPGGLSFLALLFASALALGLLIPISIRRRAALLAVIGLMVLVFGLVHLAEDVLRALYRHHPGMELLLVSNRPALLLALASLLLPAGLIGRAAAPGTWPPAILAVAGFAALAALLLGINAPGGETNLLGALIQTVAAADSLQGDRLAAAVALTLPVLAPAAAFGFLPVARAAPSTLLGVVFLLACLLVPLILAAHVAKPSHWLDALPALKTALLFAAGVLVLPVALGELFRRDS